MLVRPPTLKSFAQGDLSDTQMLGPFRESQCEAVRCVPYVGPAVSALFFLCRPYAVVRRVRAIIVDALYAVFGRGAWPHIGKEVEEGRTPPLANFNTSTAVVAVSLIRRAVAAPEDGSPGIVLRGTRVPMFMRRSPSGAPARVHNAPPQCGAPDRSGCAAFTEALPKSFSTRALPRPSKRGEQPKLVSGYVY